MFNWGVPEPTEHVKIGSSYSVVIVAWWALKRLSNHELALEWFPLWYNEFQNHLTWLSTFVQNIFKSIITTLLSILRARKNRGEVIIMLPLTVDCSYDVVLSHKPMH